MLGYTSHALLTQLIPNTTATHTITYVTESAKIDHVRAFIKIDFLT